MGIHEAIRSFAPNEKRRRVRLTKARAGNVMVFRCKDLTRLFRHRHGVTLSDDDAGREDAALMLAHLAARTDPEERMDHFLDLQCPWMAAGDRVIAKALAANSRTWWTADQLAAQVNLSMNVRTMLGITTIGAIDCDRDARKALRLEKQRLRQRDNRKRARKPSKPLGGISERAFAIREVLPEIGWRSVREISDGLANSASFAGLSAIKGAIHTALKEAEIRGLVRIRQETGPRGLPVKFVARCSE
ncbi:hypothetical protein [Tardiphaga robiniae]|uniref:Uncharacterized protein n=1 Tax=Tardiphaga robiniae TaxID=943830 RepID=A0A161QRH5_9BRAD|nr:hypothetical protein [Tardiphaga robiniae]KZD23954.1 hypothetical protein A4A58_25515 [Tardiphaga robiniae]